MRLQNLFFSLIMTVLALSLSAQVEIKSTNNTQAEVEKYYSELKSNYGKSSAIYAKEFYDKNGYPPSPEQFKIFRDNYFVKERSNLNNQIIHQSYCLESTIKFIEEKLQIWEFQVGGSLPDSTFLVLMDQFYKIAPTIAIKYCIKKWSITKVHELDLINIVEIPYIKNYPYVTYIFNHLESPMLLNTLIYSNELSENDNQKFIDLCIKHFKQSNSKETIENMQNYISSFLKIEDKIDLNDYFLTQFYL